MGVRNRYLYTALSVWAAAVVILSGGCSAKDGNTAIAVPSESRSSGAGTGKSPEAAGALQSSSETEMVRMFHFLISMDNDPAAALSRQQAEAMLPLVKKSVEKGALGEKDKLVIIALFRPEQQTMYAVWSARKRGSSGFTALAKDIDRQEGAAAPDDTPTDNGNGKYHPSGQDGENRSGPDEWASGEKNIERQLMDLLESKAQE